MRSLTHTCEHYILTDSIYIITIVSLRQIITYVKRQNADISEGRVASVHWQTTWLYMYA